MDLPKQKDIPHLFKNFSGSISVESPGRINFIGEHTDYNMGFVLPTAIDKKIYFELQRNGHSHTCNIYSKTFSSWFSFNLRDFRKSSSNWENYILGVVDEIQKLGKTLDGFDCVINSELPIGAGISSSAALECGLASGLNELFQLNLSKQEIVYLSQAAENNFVGSNCGIMDQYASVMSKKDHLLLLDCLSLEADFIPADFNSCKILLINTGVSHSLAEGEYNTRRRECESALEILQKKYDKVQTLRDVSLEMLQEARDLLNEKQFNRLSFVLSENKRVLKSREHLMAGELQSFGKLMYQSHYGLRDLYEVSCKELDFLVKATEDKSFIHGSRMMGGGFGGCTINLIEEDKIADFEIEISTAYEKQFGIKPEFITVVPGEGTIVNKI
ncbi:galactokinase [Antarcticibacterium sp. 1MA-6-2]|uniref:galactokinase n=1 Tax=Antarcticibacterium sp. 1MA-6-2 TaxID=2908210 RepID=UPI001F161A1C|nr:galactokinase [Antarcticibacterium sp. 1MA-6-2]UJH90763.1 galactokinase [Antarcticibacterium sp. 1MA-6-2]